MSGIFVEVLKRNYKQIRADRAEAIVEDTALFYKRAKEDLEIILTKLQREQANLLDVSPSGTQSLTPAKDFSAEAFVDKDLTLGIKIREVSLKLAVATERYELLFGKPTTPAIAEEATS